MDFPANLQYTKDHEWIALSGNIAQIGVTAYAVDQLGDIVHLELPNVGESFEAGSAFGTIESTKTVSDLYMPLTGKIAEVNKDALASPEQIQENAHTTWLVKVELTGTDKSGLLDAKAYEDFIKEQED